jgi:nucleoside-diphosphate-sugar epimerase
VLRLGPTTARALGLAWPVLREGAEMLYQFRQPHSVDAAAYRATIGAGRVTPYTDGIQATLRWYRDGAGRSLATVGR